MINKDIIISDLLKAGLKEDEIVDLILAQMKEDKDHLADLENAEFDGEKELFRLINSELDLDLSILSEYHNKPGIDSTKEKAKHDFSGDDIYNIARLVKELRKAKKYLYDNIAEYKELCDLHEAFKKNKVTMSDAIDGEMNLADKQAYALKVLTRILFIWMNNTLIEEHLCDETDNDGEYIQQSKYTSQHGFEYSFYDYIKHIYHYQFEFYKLSDNIDTV